VDGARGLAALIPSHADIVPNHGDPPHHPGFTVFRVSPVFCVYEMRKKTFVVTVRVTESMFRRIERLGESLSRPGIPATRTMVLRYVIVKGLEASEAVRGLNRSQRTRK
jgi:hypothetical protein